MRILFIQKDIKLLEPLGVFYLAASLRQAGHEPGLALVERKGFNARVNNFQPDILAYSVTTGFHKYYKDINQKLKSRLNNEGRNVLSIFGGPHTTFFPEFIEEDGVDIICRGEGEGAIVDLANALAHGKDYTQIANLWVKHGNKIQKNDVRPLAVNLDDLPFPARDLLYNHSKFQRDYAVKPFFPVRGCPYSCSYCFNHKYNEIYRGKGDIIRYRSVNNVIKEIMDFRSRWPLEVVLFNSDNFILNKDWINEFADRYPMEVGLPFICYVRANLIDEKIAKDLKRAGCISVQIGVESGDDHMRNDILKRNMSVDTIISAVSILKSYGIRIYTQNIVCLPGETFQQALATLNLNHCLRPDYAWASLFMPYPGTELASYAIHNGYFDGDYSSVFNNFYHLPMIKLSNSIERRMFTNLHKLFAIMVEWPCLARYVRLLCSLPITPIYTFFYRFWYGYANHFRIARYRINLFVFIVMVKRFFFKDRA
jgi:anaerobic magnesium-protoporphyrin IX monomethyl ester cyclase